MAISIKITKTTQSRISECDFNNIKFGNIFSDHMFVVDYEDGEWKNAEILPFGNLSLSPSTFALHYGQAIFEGMKAFINNNGEAQLFRPLDNWKRLNLSAKRMGMAELPADIFMDGLSKLVEIDKQWIPTLPGSALYIRPFMFAADNYVGVRTALKFKFVIFTCPVNAYYPKPLRVLVEQKYVRAFNGGVGNVKAAGNYAISMLPTTEANNKGFDQIIWTDGNEHKYVEESGTMNVFFVIGKKVITPNLDGTILAGITRDSCIKLLKSEGYEVEERKVSIDEIIEAHKNGLLNDAFGTGTAAIVAKIATFNHNGIDYNLPDVNTREVSNFLYKQLNAIQTGNAEDKFDWNLPIRNAAINI
ncbi:MAG: branched-chain amino acid aminotransferase [Bacteroidia bacterium]|nr:branched-chain amino acid aminotransferase [Bacteroidia bacterium]MCC7534484.1 branched-chain amino acid aminotransferase [Bacteroidia bacterium]